MKKAWRSRFKLLGGRVLRSFFGRPSAEDGSLAANARMAGGSDLVKAGRIGCWFPFVLLLFAPWSVHGMAPTPERTIVIDGQTYALVPTAVLVAQLLQGGEQTTLTYRQTAFEGGLFAASAGIDTVRADLDFEAVYFLGEVDFKGLVFRRPVRFARTVFARGLSMPEARFESVLDLQDCRSLWQANFKRAAFVERADFTGSHFAGTGSFIEADFEGAEAAFDRVQFGDGAYFEGARFAGRANFRDAFFEGVASFKETTWQKEVSFAGSRFKDKTFFQSARLARAIYFDKARVTGEIAFDQAVFAGPAFFRRLIFALPARFAHAIFLDTASFEGSLFVMDAAFTGAQFRAGLQLNAFFDGTLDLRHSKTTVLDLRLPAQSTFQRQVSFADSALIYLQHATFDRLLFHWSQMEGHLAAAESSGLEDLSPIYAVLRHQLRTQGLDDEARACWTAWLEHRRRSLDWRAGEWYWLQLLRPTMSYGAKPWSLGPLAGICILIFALLYRLLRSFWGDSPEPRPSSRWAWIFFSLRIFIHMGPTPCLPSGPIRLLMATESLLGWICWALFVAAVAAFLLS